MSSDWEDVKRRFNEQYDALRSDETAFVVGDAYDATLLDYGARIAEIGIGADGLVRRMQLPPYDGDAEAADMFHRGALVRSRQLLEWFVGRALTVLETRRVVLGLTDDLSRAPDELEQDIYAGLAEIHKAGPGLLERLSAAGKRYNLPLTLPQPLFNAFQQASRLRNRVAHSDLQAVEITADTEWAEDGTVFDSLHAEEYDWLTAERIDEVRWDDVWDAILVFVQVAAHVDRQVSMRLLARQAGGLDEVVLALETKARIYKRRF